MTGKENAERIRRFVGALNGWIEEGRGLERLPVGDDRDRRALDDMADGRMLAEEAADLALYFEQVGEN